MIFNKEQIKIKKVKPIQVDFYIGSLVTELQVVSHNNLSLSFHYFKSLKKSLQHYTFERTKKHTKALITHKNLAQHSKNLSCRLGIHPRKPNNLKRDQTSMMALPSQPRTSFPSLNQERSQL